MIRPLTVGMSPAFFYEGDWLLRAQLKCLSEQKARDFTVMLIDAHWQKRKGYMPELAERYKLDIVHVPYLPNQHVAKRLDCAIFNAPYCYSESSRIVRLSCWRFVRPNFTEECLNSKTNVDFRFHSCAPKDATHTHPETNHDTSIWNFGSDEVHWDAVPKRAGEPGATWGSDSDRDGEAELFPKNCYGNYMVFRDQWLRINGTNECHTNTCHYEDMDFCLRARNAGMICSRKAHLKIRLHHMYGPYSGRANVQPDNSLKHNCQACEKACEVLEPKRFDWERRAACGELDLFEEERAWVCKTCHLCGPMYSKDPNEHLGKIVERQIVTAPIIGKYKLGRNLTALAGVMDGKSLAEKVQIYNDSWTNPAYYRR